MDTTLTTFTPEEIHQALEESVQSLSERYGISALSPIEQVDALNRISRMLLTEVFSRLIDRMSDSDAEHFSSYLEGNPSEEEVFRLLMVHGEELLISTIEAVAKDFIDENDAIMSGV